MRRLSREEGEDLILMCYMSRDFREGLDAFLNKRPPQWDVALGESWWACLERANA